MKEHPGLATLRDAQRILRQMLVHLTAAEVVCGGKFEKIDLDQIMLADTWRRRLNKAMGSLDDELTEKVS